jgi:hypothetical protein
MSAEVRDQLFQRMKDDLTGPGSADEVIPDRPADRYLTGILYPQAYPIGAEQDESLDLQDGDDEAGDAGAPEDVGLATTMRPASAGISFAAVAASGGVPVIVVRISCGTYTAEDRLGWYLVRSRGGVWWRSGYRGEDLVRNIHSRGPD